MTYYSMRDIVNSLPRIKGSADSFWGKSVARPLSFLLTYVFINLGCSANFVSVLSGIVAVLACVLLAMPEMSLCIAGVVLMNLWLVLDCVDGNIARVTKTASRMGDFVDAAYGYIFSAFCHLAIGIAAYHWSSLLFGENAILNIILGALACIFNILPRLLYQKYTVMRMILAEKDGNTSYRPENDSLYDAQKRKGFTYFRQWIDIQLGTGAVMPLLILCAIFRCYDLMVAFYSLYLGASCLAVYILFSRRAMLADSEQ